MVSYFYQKTKVDKCEKVSKIARLPNRTYLKGGFSCSKDSFVVSQTLVLQINFRGIIPSLRVAAKCLFYIFLCIFFLYEFILF